MKQMNIEITGPQGCGKTLVAGALAALLSRFGAKPVIFDEEIPVEIPLFPAIISEMKRIFVGKEIFIQVSNSRKDSSPLSVDAALELLLTHAEFAQLVQDDCGEVPVDKNDHTA